MKSEGFRNHSSFLPRSPFHATQTQGLLSVCRQQFNERKGLRDESERGRRRYSIPFPPSPSRSISPQPIVGPLCLPVRPTPSVTLRKRAFVFHFPLLPLDVDDKRRRSSCQPLPHATNRPNKYWLEKKNL